MEPIIEIAMLLASSGRHQTTLSEEEQSSLRVTFTKYMEDEIEFQLAVSQVYAISGESASMEKLKAIKEVGEEPIPHQESEIDISKSRKKIHSWCPEEDNRLLAGILRHGLDGWSNIATFVGNGRTRAQCSQRWHRGLDPRIKRSNWTKQDEELLLNLIAKHGAKAWMKIAADIGNRSDVQCRYHYLQMSKEQKSLPQEISEPQSPPKVENIFKIEVPKEKPEVKAIGGSADIDFADFDLGSSAFPFNSFTDFRISQQSSLVDMYINIWD